MKNIKFFALLLSVAMIFASVSFISCKDNTEEDVTDTTTESSTTEESAPDTVVDSTTETEKETEPEVEPEGPYETDTMTSSECFNFASNEFLTLIGGLKDGFFPKIFDSESEVDGGSLKISSEKASIFGQTLFEKSFVASGSYAKNENGLVSEGTLTGETPLGYQLYITPDGQLCVRFPSVDENKFIGIDTGELFDFGEGGDSSSSTDSVDQMASIFELLEGLLENVADGLISEENAEVEVFAIKYSARKISLNYVLTDASSLLAYGFKNIKVDYYIAKGNLIRADFALSSENADSVGLSFDIAKSAEKTDFSCKLTSNGEQSFAFTGTYKENSGSVKFSFVGMQSEIGDISLSIAYERRVDGKSTYTDYTLGIIASAAGTELTVSIPIHTVLTVADDSSVSFTLNIDTQKDKIPTLLADIKMSFEMTRLAKGSDISVLMPEFTDENTIDVSDENDREELTAYFEKMNEQVPDLKSTVIDILKMLGINIGGSTEEYLSGSYTPSGVAALVTLTFDESGKAVCTILGFDTEGTYSISGNEITLDFGSGHALTGTFSFENKDTSIVIDGTEYYKK